MSDMTDEELRYSILFVQSFNRLCEDLALNVSRENLAATIGCAVIEYIKDIAPLPS